MKDAARALDGADLAARAPGDPGGTRSNALDRPAPGDARCGFGLDARRPTAEDVRMFGRGLPIEGTAGVRSRALVVTALLVAAFGVADVVRGAPALGLVVGVRVAWIAVLLAVSRDLPRPRALGGALAATAVATSVLALGALAWAGGPGGESMIFLVTVPLFVAVLLPDRVAPAAFASALAVACVSAVAALHGRPIHEVAGLAIRAAIAGGFATLGPVLHARVRREEAATIDELARVAYALEVSERQRAEAEPLAAASTRAAHDMSSPIATIACNLEWLRSAAREGRVHLDDAEALDVLEDARAAADRLRDRVVTLRAAGRAHASSGTRRT